MPSIDTLIAAIRTSLEQARQLIAGLGATHEQTTELRDDLGALGIQGSAAQVGATVDRIEEAQSQSSALADRLEAALEAIEAARNEAGGSSGRAGGGGEGASPGPAPTTPAPRGAPGYQHDRPHPISWSDRIHICHGDENHPTKGGHLSGTGRPGKTEFPPGWDDEDVCEALQAVATRPESTDSRPGGKWLVTGIYRSVEIEVVVRSDGSIEAGWPLRGPGVRRNPRR